MGKSLIKKNIYIIFLFFAANKRNLKQNVWYALDEKTSNNGYMVYYKKKIIIAVNEIK